MAQQAIIRALGFAFNEPKKPLEKFEQRHEMIWLMFKKNHPFYKNIYKSLRWKEEF